jgi:hypothetical protein
MLKNRRLRIMLQGHFPGHHPRRIHNFKPRGDPVLYIPKFLWKMFILVIKDVALQK